MLKLIRTCSNLGGGGGGDREEGGLRSAIFGQERASKKGLIVPLLVLFSMCHSTVSPFFDVPPFWGSVSCIGTQFFRGFQGGSEAMGTLEVNACTQFSGVEALSGPPPPNGYPLFFSGVQHAGGLGVGKKNGDFSLNKSPPPKKKTLNKSQTKSLKQSQDNHLTNPQTNQKVDSLLGHPFIVFGLQKVLEKIDFLFFLDWGALSGDVLVWGAASGVFLVWGAVSGDVWFRELYRESVWFGKLFREFFWFGRTVSADFLVWEAVSEDFLVCKAVCFFWFGKLCLEIFWFGRLKRMIFWVFNTV